MFSTLCYMEPTYFYSFVLPLGVLVFILVIFVLHYARKEERHNRKLKKLMRAYVKDRLKQERIFSEEIKVLDAQLRDKTIDRDTYVRLRKILELGLERRLDRVHTQLRASA
ncbi:MAG: hypothetical protein O2V44_10545 [Candidatus Bathyarchaeota archaeon]|nr:hypothetical protein [Candidatus Bathyarchaeota archaeon]